MSIGAAMTSIESRFWRLVNKGADDECWLWLGTKYRGYGKMTIGGKSKWAHRVSYELFVGPLDKEVLLHLCDNPPCVNPHHLRPGTQQENIADCIAKGRALITHKAGELAYQSKLSWENVQEIRSSTESVRVLAARFNVSPSSVHSVRIFKTWKTQGEVRLENVGG